MDMNITATNPATNPANIPQAIPFTPKPALRVPKLVSDKGALNHNEVMADLEALRGHEKASREIINARLPQIIAHVIDGGNVGLVNDIIACTLGNRKQGLAMFVREFLPHEYNKKSGKFGKRFRSVKAQQVKVDAFLDFLNSGKTVFGWVKDNVKSERKPVNHVAAMKKHFFAMLDEGQFSREEAIAMLFTMVEEADQREKAEEKAA